MPAAENGVSISELFARVLFRIADTVEAANHVLVHKEHFTELAKMVNRMKPILLELRTKNVQDASESIQLALGDLGASIEKALKLLQSCSSGSICLLLFKSPDILKKIQDITLEIGKCLDRLSLAQLDLSLDTSAKIAELCGKSEFKAAIETKAITVKLKDAFREEHINSQNELQLLHEIAEITGTSMGLSFVAREIEAVQRKKTELEEHKRQAEAHYLEQVIAFLYRSDPLSGTASDNASSPANEDIPIKSFCCPLTKQLMQDPVEISSGFSFERAAILEWFEKGNKTCPVTSVPLETFSLHPNLNLLESIKEWKERNVMSKLEKAAEKIFSDNMEEVDGSLSELCQMINKARDITTSDELLIPQLVMLARFGDRISIRNKAMQCLSSLAAKSSRNKELITTQNGINLAVECLAQENTGIRAQGVALLLELSKDSKLCSNLGEARSCILQLVSLVSSGEKHLANSAQETLEHMSVIVDNLRCMTQANHFPPLISKLKRGSIYDKVEMAKLLGESTLTDYSRATLVQQGILPPLVHVLYERNLEANRVALTALQNLSRHSDIRGALLETDVVKPLLELLQNRENADSRCHKMAAELLAYLAVPMPRSSTETEAHGSLKLLEEKETICALIVLLATDAHYSIKEHLLQILLGIASMETTGTAQEDIRDAGAIQLLLSLCEERDTGVRLSTLRLLNILTEDTNAEHLVESLEEKHIRNFVMAFRNSKIEEKVLVSGILSKLSSHNSLIMDILIKTEALPAVMQLLSSQHAPSRESDCIIENALSVFLLFTGEPLSHVLEELTQFETTSILVRILSSGTPLAKQRAATTLAQLSVKTMHLSRPAIQTSSSTLLCCWVPRSSDVCTVHGKVCSARLSFCLVEANAIVPLVKTLSVRECHADEAALNALDTLLVVETWGCGIKAIAEAQGLQPIVQLLTKGTPKAQERVLPVLEKMTRDTDYCNLIGKAEELVLIQLMQQGSHRIKKLAATILGNAGKIPHQSSYF